MGAHDSIVSRTISSGEDISSPAKIDPTVTVTDPELGKTTRIRDDPEARVSFLATFTPAESKAIISKVDKRFFVLAGLMFMVKNVSASNILGLKMRSYSSSPLTSIRSTTQTRV